MGVSGGCSHTPVWAHGQPGCPGPALPAGMLKDSDGQGLLYSVSVTGALQGQDGISRYLSRPQFSPPEYGSRSGPRQVCWALVALWSVDYRLLAFGRKAWYAACANPMMPMLCPGETELPGCWLLCGSRQRGAQQKHTGPPLGRSSGPRVQLAPLSFYDILITHVVQGGLWSLRESRAQGGQEQEWSGKGGAVGHAILSGSRCGCLLQLGQLDPRGLVC